MTSVVDAITPAMLAADAGVDLELATRFHRSLQRVFDRAAGGNSFVVGLGWVFGLDDERDPAAVQLLEVADELAALAGVDGEVEIQIPDEALLQGREIWLSGDVLFTIAEDLDTDEDGISGLFDSFEARLRAELDVRPLRHVATRPSLERALGDWLIEHLDEIVPEIVDEDGRPLGRLRVVKRERTFLDGCRADVVCRLDSGDWVVFELKSGRAGVEAYEQLQHYMELLEAEAEVGEAVMGLLVALGMTPHCRALVHADPRVEFRPNNWLENWTMRSDDLG